MPIIKFNKPTILGFNGQLLKPGINEISKESFDMMKADKIIQSKFESGELELVSNEKETKSGEKVDGVDALLRMNDKKAARIAGETVDMDLLSAWSEWESRKDVLKILRAQMKKISNVEFREDSGEPAKKYSGEVHGAVLPDKKDIKHFNRKSKEA